MPTPLPWVRAVSPVGTRRVLAAALAALAALACGEGRRFAPPPADDLAPPERADLAGEDLAGLDTPVGPLPALSPPALRCLAVAPDGRLSLPPLGPLRPLTGYRDDIACLVVVQSPEGAPPYRWLSLSVLSRTGPALLAELPLPAPKDGAQSRLVWLAPSQWAGLGGDSLSLEAVARCDASHPDPGCDLRLARSFSRRLPGPDSAPALPAPEPKTARGMPLRWAEPSCAPYDDRGMPASPLSQDARADLTAGLRCSVEVENPGDAAVEGARWEVRLAPLKGASLARAARALPRVEPGARASLQLHLPPSPHRGPALLLHTVGRNPAERAKSERSLRLVLESQAPDSLPSPPPAPSPPSDPEDTD